VPPQLDTAKKKKKKKKKKEEEEERKKEEEEEERKNKKKGGKNQGVGGVPTCHDHVHRQHAWVAPPTHAN
jgi:hypothetical protein